LTSFTELRLRRVSSKLPLDCLKSSSRIEAGMRVPFGSPYRAALYSLSVGVDFAALSLLTVGVDEVWGIFPVLFFGMGVDDDFDGSEDEGEAFGDDGETFLRGMDAYTVLAAAGFEWASASFFSATSGSGSVLIATATGGGVASGFDAAAMDLVTRVGSGSVLTATATGGGDASGSNAATMDLVTRVVATGFFFWLFSSSLSANKSSSSSSSELPFSSLDMLESRTPMNIRVGHVLFRLVALVRGSRSNSWMD